MVSITSFNSEAASRTSPPSTWFPSETGPDYALLVLSIPMCFLWYYLQQRRWRGFSVTSPLLSLVSTLKFIGGITQCKSKPSAAWQRKAQFLKSCGQEYGYAQSEMGHIDTWRSREFPTLVPPLQKKPELTSRQDSLEVYLDYAGAALASKSQQRDAFLDASTGGVLANPHSTGPAAFRTWRKMQESKRLVLQHFGCTSARHPGYDVIFTSGATESLRLLAERFPWRPKRSTLLYSHNAHTSLVGMRRLVPGRRFVCQTSQELCSATSSQFHEWANHNNPTDLQDTNKDKDICIPHLLALPLECNFSGERLNVHSAIAASRKAGASDRSRDDDDDDDKLPKKDQQQPQHHQWYTLLDIAKAAATSPIYLCDLDPDFAVVSFYKLFGLPTGLGALFVKNSTAPLLASPLKAPYLGGGAVDFVLPRIDVMYPRSSSPLASMTCGTAHFDGIVSLQHGFRHIHKLGGMDKVEKHTQCLAAELVRRFKALHHSNGRKAVVLYGPWNDMLEHLDATSSAQYGDKMWRSPGPTVAFSVVRHDGSFVGYNEVSKLAGLWDTPLQLRTGCFCNAGACQEALGLTDDEVLHNFEVGGHVCGDHFDILNDRPTGAVRASFGKDSLWEDLDVLVNFLQQTFVTTETTSPPGPDSDHEATDDTDTPKSWFLSELYVFPIKSCAAQQVGEWRIHATTGRLEYDREFALVAADGTAMRLQSYPKMGLIQPRIECGCMTVSAPQRRDLVLSLVKDDDASSAHCERQFRVCGNTCGGRLWGGERASEWFSDFLGVHCWLVRYAPSTHSNAPTVSNNAPRLHRRTDVGYVNESPLLLVTQTSVDVLNQVLRTKGRPPVTPRKFRPNLVIATSKSMLIKSIFTGQRRWRQSLESEEDCWSSLVVQGRNFVFRVDGACARCSMIDVDPTTTTRGSALRALAEYRRQEGQIYFGIFLSCDRLTVPSSLPTKDDYIALKQGDCFVPNQKLAPCSEKT